MLSPQQSSPLALALLLLLGPITNTITTANAAAVILSERDITCLKIGQTATASWTNANKEFCTWTGVVGSNFGINPVNKGNYGCNGRCGEGCNGLSLGNAYTQNCFSHDICSYFYNAAGGGKDPNCGEAFKTAQPDFFQGVLRGCGQDNPNVGPQVPTTRPVCVKRVASYAMAKSWNSSVAAAH